MIAVIFVQLGVFAVDFGYVCVEAEWFVDQFAVAIAAKFAAELAAGFGLAV